MKKEKIAARRSGRTGELFFFSSCKADWGGQGRELWTRVAGCALWTGKLVWCACQSWWVSDCVVRWDAWPCSLCSRQRVPDSITRLGPCGARLRSFLPQIFFFFCTLQRESASSVSARVHVSVGLDNNYWAVGATKWSHWPREEPGCQAWRLEGKKWQNGEMETGWRPRSLSWGLCGAQPGEDDDAIGPA